MIKEIVKSIKYRIILIKMKRKLKIMKGEKIWEKR